MTIEPNHAQTTGRAYVNRAFCSEGLSADAATGCSLAGVSCGLGVSCSVLSEVTMTSRPAVSSPMRPRTLTLLVAGGSTMLGTKGASVTSTAGRGGTTSGSRSVGSSSTSGGLPEPGNGDENYQVV